MTYGDIPPIVEVDPDTQGRNNPCARARAKEVLALLFKRREAPIRIPEAPLGMLVNYTLITPRDDCPIRKVMPTPGQVEEMKACTGTRITEIGRFRLLSIVR